MDIKHKLKALEQQGYKLNEIAENIYTVSNVNLDILNYIDEHYFAEKLADNTELIDMIYDDLITTYTLYDPDYKTLYETTDLNKMYDFIKYEL